MFFQAHDRLCKRKWCKEHNKASAATDAAHETQVWILQKSTWWIYVCMQDTPHSRHRARSKWKLFVFQIDKRVMFFQLHNKHSYSLYLCDSRHRCCTCRHIWILKVWKMQFDECAMHTSQKWKARCWPRTSFLVSYLDYLSHGQLPMAQNRQLGLPIMRSWIGCIFTWMRLLSKFQACKAT